MVYLTGSYFKLSSINHVLLTAIGYHAGISSINCLHRRWLDYSQFSKPVEGLPIMACKVPLKKVGNNFSILIDIAGSKMSSSQGSLPVPP